MKPLSKVKLLAFILTLFSTLTYCADVSDGGAKYFLSPAAAGNTDSALGIGHKFSISQTESTANGKYPQVLLSGSYTIGGPAADFSSIGEAINALDSSGISGPVTLDIYSGVYNEQLTIPSINGASDSCRIILQSVSGNAADVTITYDAIGINDYWTIMLDGADYFVIKNLSIMAEDSTFAKTVAFKNNADYNELRNCVLISQPEARSSSHSACIYSSSPGSLGNIIDGCELWNGYYGCYIHAQGWEIRNNKIQDYYSEGIRLHGMQDPIIINNYFKNEKFSSTEYALDLRYCTGAIYITKNKFELTGYGQKCCIRLDHCTSNISAQGTIANNMMSVFGPSNSTNYGLYVTESSYQRFLNNSIHIESGNISGSGGYFENCDQFLNMNNIYFNTNASPAICFKNVSNYVSDFNNYWTNGVVLGILGTITNITSLSSLQLNSGQDASSHSIDPSFNSQTLLCPINPGLDNLGVPYSNIVDDFFGNMRHPITPDIGCIEFSPKQYDAGIISIDTPLRLISPGIAGITVTIKNFGMAALTSCDLFYSIDGGSAATINWMGNIPPGGAETSTFLGNHNFSYGYHRVEAWTSNPNQHPDTSSFNDTAHLYLKVCDVMDSTYTIGGPNSGADFISIGEAIDAMLGCGVGGMVTFNILPGIYNEQVVLPEIPGASDENRIVFQSISGNPADVILQFYSSNIYSGQIWSIKGADYIEIRNLSFQAPPGSMISSMIELQENAYHNILDGNIFRNLSGTLNTTGIRSAPGFQHNNLRILSNTFLDCTIGLEIGSISGGGLHSGTVIHSNHFINCRTGIYVYSQYSLRVEENIVRNTTTTNGQYGIQLFNCTEDTRVARNRITLNAYDNIIGLDIVFFRGTPSNQILISNNWVTLTNPGSLAGWGLRLWGNQHLKVYNNTVNVQSLASGSSALYIYDCILGSTVATDNDIVDNIFAHKGEGNAVRLLNGCCLGIIDWMDHNDLYTTGPHLVSIGFTNFDSLVDWQSFTLHDTLSVSMQAEFVSSEYLLPRSDSLNNKGLVLPEITDDIFGNLRSATTPDMGAIEFSPSINDVGVINVFSPFKSISPGLYNIIINFKNFGKVNVNSVTIEYSINGIKHPSFSWSGNLAPDSISASITLGSSYYNYGNYELKIWSSFPNGGGDDIAVNDTLHQSIKVCDLVSGTYTIGDTMVGADFASFGDAVAFLLPCGINDSVVFLVDSGHYFEQLTIPEINGTSDSSRIIFQSISGNATDVVLHYSYTTIGRDWVLSLDGADYITFRNMTIRPDSNSWDCKTVSLQNSANYNEFIGCTLINNESSDFRYSVVVSAPTFDEYNLFRGCFLKGGSNGFYVQGGAGGERGNVIKECDISGFSLTGIAVKLQNNSIISNNTIYDGPTIDFTGGISYTGSEAAEISGNWVEVQSATQQYGILINHLASDGQFSASVFNNIIVTDPSSLYGSALRISGYDLSVCYNTIRVLGSSQNAKGIIIENTSSNLEILNNLVTTSMGPALEIDNGAYISSISRMDHNNLYCADSAVAKIYGIYYDMSNWQVISAFDSNSVSFDPGYLFYENPAPTIAIADNLGIPLATINNDYYGNPRSLSTPDIGAIEFNVPLLDAWLRDLTSPVGGCDLGVENVSIVIYNFGVSTITDSLYAKYRLFGSPIWLSELVPDSIPVNDSITFTFNTPIDLSGLSDTVFQFQVCVDLKGDPVQWNDSIVAGIRSFQRPSIPLVSDTTVLAGNSALLKVHNPDQAYTYRWYDGLNSNNQINTGITYQTPVLYSTKVYEIDAIKGSVIQNTILGTGQTYGWNTPTAANYKYSWSASLYLADELNTNGYIDSIAYFVRNNITFPVDNQKIYIKMIADTAFSTYNKPDTNEFTEVYSGSIIWKGIGWNAIALNKPFYYNGTDNLLIMWENTSGTMLGGVYVLFDQTHYNTYKTIYNYSYGTPPSITGYGDLNRPDLRLIGIGDGCPSYRFADTVFVLQSLAVNTGNDIEMCFGDTVQLFANAYGGWSGYTYTWSPSSGLNDSTLQNPLASPIQQTNYTVTVTDLYGYTATDDVLITIYPSPTVTLGNIPNICLQSDPRPLTQGSPPGGTYSGPGVNGGILYPMIAGSGTHLIHYSYENPYTACSGSASKLVVVDPCSGFEESEAVEKITIFPNPGAGLLRLTIGFANDGISLKIVDITGRIVYQESLASNNEAVTYDLDLRELPRGVYYACLQGKSWIVVRKIVLQ